MYIQILEQKRNISGEILDRNGLQRKVKENETEL